MSQPTDFSRWYLYVFCGLVVVLFNEPQTHSKAETTKTNLQKLSWEKWQKVCRRVADVLYLFLQTLHKKHRTKTTKNLKNKKHAGTQLFASSQLRVRNLFCCFVCFFFVLVLCFVVFYCFVLFGVLYAAKMKDTAKVKLQTANKKTNKPALSGFALLFCRPHFMLLLWFVCWVSILKLKPGSWQMATLLVKLWDAHSNPKDNLSKKMWRPFSNLKCPFKKEKRTPCWDIPTWRLHEFTSEITCDHSDRHFWCVLK